MRNRINAQFQRWYASAEFDAFDKTFLVLVAAFLLLRLVSFDYQIFATEANRDYLISHNIVAHRSFVWVGADTSFNIENSPAYPYLLSLFLLVRDSFVSLGLVNVFLQTATIVAVYVLARTIFGSATALVAAALFGFASVTVFQAARIWSPYLMHPFVNLSYVALLFAYTKRRYALLLVSIALFAFSVALHMIVLFLAPVFLALVVYVLRSQKARVSRYLCAGAAMGGTFLLLFAPNLVHYVRTSPPTSFPALPLTWSGAQVFNEDVAGSLKDNLVAIARIFLNETSPFARIPHAPVVLGLTLGAAMVVYFSQKERRREKGWTLLILGVMVYQFLLVSALNGLRPYYFIPIYGLLFIFVAEIVRAVFSKSALLRANGALLLFVLLLGSTSDFSKSRLPIVMASLRTFAPAIAADIKFNDAVAAALAEEVARIKREERMDRNDFFQMRVYDRNNNGSREEIDAAYWVLLEKELRTAFTENDDTVWWAGYRPLNDDAYVFVICQFYAPADAEAGCLPTFAARHPEYAVVRRVFADERLTMFLAKAENRLLPLSL